MNEDKNIEITRRKALIAAGGSAGIALAGCLDPEDEDDDSEEDEPPREINPPDEEPLGFMAEASNYINGHRDNKPEPDFEVENLHQPWQTYVETLQHVMD